MTTTPLPQVVGFDAPIDGGFWAPTDRRERIDWVLASGLTIAEASAELGVSAASVYRNKRRISMKAIFWAGDGLVIWYKPLERGTWQLPDNWAKNSPQHVIVPRIEESWEQRFQDPQFQRSACAHGEGL
jgi:hypothetical protein